MRKSIDWKIITLIVLSACAIVLTSVRERRAPSGQPSASVAPEEKPARAVIGAIVDSTMVRMGVETRNIRHVQVSVGEAKGIREELRVAVPPTFEVLRAITALTDSLRRFDVTLVSTENLREKTSSIHLLYEKHVFESIIISKERPKKGVETSVSRKQKGPRRRSPR
ncbi:MAG TPA: hypothetical protein VMM58_04310 [Bacteroidota bacterium]|nr:hypothetical protein [Bacteroidota bacterium]